MAVISKNKLKKRTMKKKEGDIEKDEEGLENVLVKMELAAAKMLYKKI